MAERWFCLYAGEKHGPLTTAQLKRLVAAGLLQPDDAVWPDDGDPDLAVQASDIVDFDTVRKPVASPPVPEELPPQPKGQEPSLRAARTPKPQEADFVMPPLDEPVPLPDWLEDVDYCERSPPTQATSLPDWLMDVGTPPASTPPPPSAKPRTNEKPAPSRGPAESAAEAFAHAQRELADWAACAATQELLLGNDRARLRQDAALRAILLRYQPHGRAFLVKLSQYLGFLIENRQRGHPPRS